MLKEFRDFITRGNILDLAVAFVLGAAFTVIVKSLVSDILMPPVGLIFGDISLADRFITLKDGGSTSGPYSSLAAAQEAGAVTINYGTFIDAVIAFLIIGFWMFLIVRYVKKLQERNQQAASAAPPSTKTCPFCHSKISIEALKCAFCTSELGVEPAV
ncbi:MAG: large conductance mechanosensitive channel protein MscL [Chloroflexi bacterium]|nr:large conductance mechanosensitive channel protein MscL [Chloroflexota bacterium]MDA1297954.1 large conductance mechanosensitive channel protein MscL [Chloroflexota bacterium]